MDRVELDVTGDDWSVQVCVFDGVGIRVAFKYLQCTGKRKGGVY